MNRIRERGCLYQPDYIILFLALLRMGGYRILPRVRPQIIYIGQTSQIPCDKKSRYSILSTLVSLGSKGVYIGVLSTRMYSLLYTIEFDPFHFWDGFKSKKAWFTCNQSYYNLRCHYNQKGPKLYTPLSWRVIYLVSAIKPRLDVQTAACMFWVKVLSTRVVGL